LAFVLSNREKQKLSENGYVYVKNRKFADGEEVFWNCEKRMSDKCKAIVHTKTGDVTVIRRINEHNYSGNGTPEQMLHLLSTFTFYGIDFFGEFFKMLIRQFCVQ